MGGGSLVCLCFTKASGIGLKDEFDLVADAAEGVEFTFALADGMGWVLESPMVAVEHSGEGGAGLVGIAADRNDGGDSGIEVLVEVVGGMMGGVDADFGKGFEGEGMNGALGFGAGTEDFKKVAAGGAQNAFRHMAAAGVSGAEDEYFWFFHRLGLSVNYRNGARAFKR